MIDFVEAIRVAIEPDATGDARAAGAAACRSILATLDPQPAAVAPQPLVSPDAVAQLAGMLRGMNLDQLFDVAIAKLRALEAARPASTPAAAPRTFTYLKVPLPAGK